MEINLEEFEKARNSYNKPSEYNSWVMVQEGEWVQDGKDQQQTCIVQDSLSGKYYSFNVRRSGSPFTSWYYPHEDKDKFNLTEVSQQTRTVTITEWVEVPPQATYIEADVEDHDIFRLKLPNNFYEEHAEDIEKILDKTYLFEWYFRGCLMCEEEHFQAVDLPDNSEEVNREITIEMLLSRCEDTKGMEKLHKALTGLY